MDIDNRIKEILKHLNMRPTPFANEIGVTPTAILNIVNGKRSPGKEIITKILQKYPEISESWLILGEGSLLKAKDIPANTNDINDLYDYRALVSRVEELGDRVRVLEEALGIQPGGGDEKE